MKRKVLQEYSEDISASYDGIKLASEGHLLQDSEEYDIFDYFKNILVNHNDKYGFYNE